MPSPEECQVICQVKPLSSPCLLSFCPPALFAGQFLLHRLDLDYSGKHSPGLKLLYQFMLQPMTRSKSEDFIKISYVINNVICMGQGLGLYSSTL